MTWSSVSRYYDKGFLAARRTYRNAIVVLLANALRLGLALLKGVLVLEFRSHGDRFGGGGCSCVWVVSCGGGW